jgi:hypothetical protein
VRNAYKILVRNPYRKRLLGRHRHRCKDNIKMELKEMSLKVVDWI